MKNEKAPARRGRRTIDDIPLPKRRKQVLLDDETVRIMTLVGRGSLSAGIRLCALRIRNAKEQQP